MKVRDIFAKDINRDINGVIKVAQDDTDSMRQELSEYVVTKELQRHFANFFEAYDAALDTPTDKVGVWISGFFGSGKSHFLKMLSYLLSNREVESVPAIEYFNGKLEDPLVYSRMRRAAEVPTESILFNIDSKGGHWKGGSEGKTALLRTFARVFYENMGFYGEDLKLARMEQFIEEKGKTAQFREAFHRVNGGDWLADRENYDFFEDDIVEVMQEVLGMSRESAQHWFDGTEKATISPETLTNEIAAYARKRAEENGGQFRLLFMVDEVGQFIGSDVNLMLNLQTLVEDLGAKCGGRVWVMVTSQEAIDEVTKVAGNDFSKIQGRFNTRLSLSSSSVDEVIKRRVLEKTDAAAALLGQEFEEQRAVLNNLFSFEDSRSDLRGFSGRQDFVESYPFADYQFKVLPSILAEIRKHGNSGKHLSGGERSMLSGFQEAAQKIQEGNSTALVPLWRFYDTISTFLEHGIRQVIERAARAADASAGLVPADLEVLKTLYLIRYIPDIKPSVGNIAILMVQDMDVDKLALKEQVQGSLERLVRENYIARNGDRYSFLTDEEQDVAREIANTVVEPAAVQEEIKKLVFGDLYTSQKYRLGKNDFPFDRYVDDTIYGAPQGGMKLNVITVALSDLSDADDGTLALKSSGQALVVLPQSEDRYYEALMNALRIGKYANVKSGLGMTESVRRIVADKQREAKTNRDEARQYLEQAIAHARIAVDGQLVDVRSSAGRSVRAVLDAALDKLVNAVFKKAGYITSPVEGQADVVVILSGGGNRGLEGFGGGNERALQEMETYLENQNHLHLDTSMGELQRKFQAAPFGWREVDIAAVVAALLAQGSAQARRAGKVLNPQDANDRKVITGLLAGKNADELQVKKRVLPSQTLMSRARALLKQLSDASFAPEDIDGLTKAVADAMEEQLDWCRQKLNGEYEKGDYPGRAVVEQGASLASEVLRNRADETMLLKAFAENEDALLDWAEDAEAVRGFFPNQQRLFDNASALKASMRDEMVYLADCREAQEALDAIGEILVDPCPYGKVSQLPARCETVQRAHGEVVRVGRNDVLDSLDSAIDEIRDYAEGQPLPPGFLDEVEREKAAKRGQVSAAQTRAQLDAYATQLETWRKAKMSAIDRAVEDAREAAEREAAMRVRQEEGVTVKKPVPGTGRPADWGVSAVPLASAGAAALSPSEPRAVGEATAAPRRPRAKTFERRELCPARSLTSQEEVDAYVDAIRKKLTDALVENGSVRVH